MVSKTMVYERRFALDGKAVGWSKAYKVLSRLCGADFANKFVYDYYLGTVEFSE